MRERLERTIQEEIFMKELHEECGVFGVYAPKTTSVASTTYYGLYSLQHRGQESCGIVVCDDGLFYSHKDLGLVGDVFAEDVLSSLPKGNMAIGHVRYGTTGGTNRANCQPIEVNHLKGRLAIAHNGNLSNAYELRADLEMGGAIFHTTSDTEIIAYTVIQERILCDSIEEAVSKAVRKLDGAYSLILMSATKLIAVRDKYGFRPLCYGITPDGAYIAASESCALSAVGARFIRDIEPGEIVVFDETGVHSIKRGKVCRQSFCAFEYIYFARPDSVLEGTCVHEARKQAGRFLAQEHPVEADVVIGVPDSGLDAALGYSQESGIPYGIGFIKNKYIGRTFIQGSQKQRENSVRIKLNAISSTVKGKRVVLVDDSIVRGTTSARIIKLLRDAGATEVHFMVSAPPFKYPCYFGTDIPDQKLLVATGRTVDQINEIIGADTLGYLSTEHVVQLAKNANCGFCTACFTGEYAVKPDEVLSTDIHERHLNDRPKDEKKLGE